MLGEAAGFWDFPGAALTRRRTDLCLRTGSGSMNTMPREYVAETDGVHHVGGTRVSLDSLVYRDEYPVSGRR